MGLTVGIIGAVAAVAGAANSVVSGNQARASQRHAADLQTQAQNEQKAQNAQANAQAARQQVRDERIKRARIMQASDNSGTDYSSGELGAIGSLSTQLGVNQGNQQGAYDRGVVVGNLNQGAANSMFDAQQTLNSGAELSSIFGAVSNISFAYGKPISKVPGTTPQAT